MTTHTPGPWIVDADLGIYSEHCAIEITPHVHFKEDAYLIAAAPDLLFAAQWALNTLRDPVSCPDGCPDELEAALVAAIARIKGR